MDHLLPEKKNRQDIEKPSGRNSASQPPFNRAGTLMKVEINQLDGKERKMSRLSFNCKRRQKMKRVDTSAANKVRSGANKEDQSDISQEYDNRSVKDGSSHYSQYQQPSGLDFQESNLSDSRRPSFLNQQIKQANEGTEESDSVDLYKHQIAIGSGQIAGFANVSDSFVEDEEMKDIREDIFQGEKLNRMETQKLSIPNNRDSMFRNKLGMSPGIKPQKNGLEKDNLLLRKQTMGPGISGALQRKEFGSKKVNQEEQKEALKKAIKDSELLTARRMQTLAKQKLMNEKKEEEEDPDFHLNPKNFKRRETIEGGQALGLKQPNNIPDDQLLRPRRPSNIADLGQSSANLASSQTQKSPLGQSQRLDLALEPKPGFKVSFQNEDINQYIYQKGNLPLFTTLWAKIILTIHLYSFFTVFYFMGIAGFPQGVWLTMEVITEMIILVDFFMRIVIRKNFPTIWPNMWILNDKGQKSLLFLMIRLVGSMPTSIICRIFVRPEMLSNFWLAALRSVKLLRMRQIGQYFDSRDIHDKQKITSYLKTLQVVIYFFLATHTIGCIWLIVGRLQLLRDPEAYTWIALAGFDENEASDFDRYIDSVFFVVATMTGLGYGNIVPTTFWEYFVDIFIMITGSSIYANFFANFTVTIQNRNWRKIENTKKLEEAKNFATLRHLPEELKSKIRLYYNQMRLKYGKLYEKYRILHELPLSLRSELSLFINSEIIQKVKFFQLADPSFILTMSRLLKPRLSMAGDFVIQRGEIATIMYFIKKGFVEILASDERTIVAYLGEGSYFGEIGVLLTGKRTVSVKSKTPCIFFIIEKDELVETLENYPSLSKYLKAVGRQRFQTTHPQDLKENDEDFEEQKQKQEGVFDTIESDEEVGMFEIKSSKTHEQANSMRFQNIRQMSVNMKREKLRQEIKERRKVKWNLTKNYYFVNYFVIIPMSKLFILWSFVISAAIFYDLLYVPYSIALDVEEKGALLLLDFTSILIYVVDVYMRLKTGLVDNKIEIDLDAIAKDYLGFKVLLDICAIIPIDYILLGFGINSQIRHFFRIPRLFKVYRCAEIIKAVRAHSNIKIPLFTISLLFFLFILLAHYMATFYVYIGRREYLKDRRFDDKTMFADVLNRDFVNLPEVMTMDPFSQYVQFFYLSCGTMGAVMYGDIIPFALSEQLFTFVAMFTARIFLAFLFAEAASFLSSIHSSYSNHVLKLNRITKWMRLNNFPRPLIDRVINYYDMIWKHFKGIDEQAILKDMPESMRQKVRLHIFKTLVENAEIFPSTADKGAIVTLIQKLKIKIIPKKENIIRHGEIAQEMYFIMKGLVKVFEPDGSVIAVLGKGHNFGEMALLKEDSVRNASILADTDVSVAILTIYDFKLICDLYPEFQEKIKQVVTKRQLLNQENQNQKKELMMDQMRQYEEVLRKKRISKVSDQLSQIAEESKKESSEWDSQKDESQQENWQNDNDLNSDDYEVEESSYNSIKSSARNKQITHIKISDEQRKEIQEELKQTQMKTSVLDMIDDHEKIRTIQIEAVTPVNNHPGGMEEDSKEETKAQDTIQYNSAQTLIEDPPDTQRQMIPSLKHQKTTPKPKLKRTETNEINKAATKKARSTINAKFGSISMSVTSSYDSMVKRHKIFNQKVVQIEDHFRNIAQDEPSFSEKLFKRLTKRLIMTILVFFTIIYNMIFIPLQFAYDVHYDWPYWFFEIITMIVYAFDFYLRKNNLDQLIKTNGKMYSSSNFLERRLAEDKEEYERRKRNVRVELVCSGLAFVPFSMIFDLAGVKKDNIFIVMLCLLRLVKIWPVYKIFKTWKKREVDLIRIFEVIFSYYFACHIITCYVISIAINAPDVRETWMRRIPVPQTMGEDPENNFKAGFRQNPTVEDMTNGSIYIHALYFTVNTVSHVAIGDITMVTTEERLFNAVLVLMGTFIYAFLFGNIASIVADLAPNIFINFHEKYQYVMGRINKEKTPRHVIQSISNYYDYIWAHSKGINEEQLIKELPQSISSDILLCRYQEAIESSIIFKDKQGNIDVALTNSVLKLIKIRVYMRNDFIVKVGSYGSNTYLILDGEAAIFGINNELMGILKSGCHYSSDVPKQLNNFGKKRIVHVIARTLTIVGVFKKQDIEYLYRCYPEWETKMKLLNCIIRQAAQKHLSRYMKALNSGNSIPIQIKFIENHITYSNEKVYENILQLIESNKYLNQSKIPDELNFINFLKIKYYQKTGFVPVQDRETFKLFKNSQTKKCKVKIKNFRALEPVQTNLRKVLPKQLSLGSEKIKIKRASTLRFRSKRGILIQDRAPSWLRCFYIQMNSNSRFVIDFICFINLFYIALIIPFQIGFHVPIRGNLILIEVLSLIYSIFIVIANFRTPVMVKGEATLKIRQVLKYQWQNGLLLDLLGILPFNLIFGILDLSHEQVLWAILRCLRIGSAWKSMQLFGQFEIYLKRYNLLMQIIKSFCLLFFLCHFTSCLWFFVQRLIIDTYPIDNWTEYHEIDQKPRYYQYTFTMYCVINVVSSVGYGDFFAHNDVERMFIVFMINMADALFALAFGLIAAITMHISQNDELRHFIKKMAQIEDFMNSFQIDSVQRSRVEQYMAYTYYQKTNNELLVWNDLADYLPYNLLKEVIYYNSREMLTPMFSQFKSENLIRELASVLENLIFLPGDYIVHKDDIGNEMYFIVQGRVFIIAADKQTVLNTLGKGAFFGEIAIFCESKRISYVQAETFCIVAVLMKKDIDRIVHSFPKVAIEFKAEAEKRKMATQAIEDQAILKKKQQEQNSDDEILQQYYDDSQGEDDDDDDEDGESEMSSYEKSPKMAGKKKSLAQKMNLNNKRDTVILLSGSTDKKSGRKILKHLRTDKTGKLTKLQSIQSQEINEEDSLPQTSSVSTKKEDKLRIKFEQKEDLTPSPILPQDQSQHSELQLPRVDTVQSEEEEEEKKMPFLGDDYFAGPPSSRDIQGIKGQPTQTGGKRRGTMLKELHAPHMNLNSEEEHKTLTIPIPSHFGPNDSLQRRKSSRSEAVKTDEEDQMKPINLINQKKVHKKKSGILKQQSSVLSSKEQLKGINKNQTIKGISSILKTEKQKQRKAQRRFSNSVQSISSSSIENKEIEEQLSPIMSLHASVKQQKKNQILDSGGKPAKAIGKRKRRPTVVDIYHRSTSGLLDPFYDQTKSADKKIISVIRETQSASGVANKSDTESDKEVYVAGGIGDDGNVSIMKKKDKRTGNLRRKGIKNQRRLSRISLGKNLMLSQTAGLKLQWTVGHN